MQGIAVTDLTKEYQKRIRAVDNVSFEVTAGEIFALLGPNGAGKTTLFKMLTMQSKPTHGNITILGQPVTEKSTRIKERIGYSCQQFGLDPESSGLFNLKLFGRYYGLYGKKLEKRIEELTEIFHLKDFINRKVKFYSGGMKKKLELATSIMNQPNILFLDEPTLGLDIESRQILWNVIKALNEENGMTIVLTTHYLEEADRLCDSLAIIEGGKLAVTGELRDLKKQVADDIVKIEFSKYEDAEKIMSVKEQLSASAFVKNIKQVHQSLILNVKDAQKIIGDVTETVHHTGIVNESISMTKASLEDVYLEYVGSYLVEEQA